MYKFTNSKLITSKLKRNTLLLRSLATAQNPIENNTYTVLNQLSNQNKENKTNTRVMYAYHHYDEQLQPLRYKTTIQCLKQIQPFSSLSLANAVTDFKNVLFDYLFDVFKMRDYCTLFQLNTGYESGIYQILRLFNRNGLTRRLHLPRPCDPLFLYSLPIYNITYCFYRYLNYREGDFNFGGLLEDMILSPMKSCFILNSSCFELNKNEWNEIRDVCKSRDHLLWINIMDTGYHSQSIKDECSFIQSLVKANIRCIINLDLEDSFGLYGCPMGCTFVCNNTLQSCDNYEIGNSMIMECVMNILKNDKLCTKWENEMKIERDRLQLIRSTLMNYNLPFINQQSGVYSLLPISLKRINSEFLNISMINTTNIKEKAMQLQTLFN